MTIEKFAFPSASDVQCRDRRRLDPSMRIVPGTDCAAWRYEINIGRRSPAFPVTPPGVRVRTGRFGGLSYRPPVNLGIPSESK